MNSENLKPKRPSPYKEFTNKVKGLLGDCNWPLIGKLHKKYKEGFILDCALKMSRIKKLNSLTAEEKSFYLATLCNAYFTEKDLVEKNTLPINPSDFTI